MLKEGKTPRSWDRLRPRTFYLSVCTWTNISLRNRMWRNSKGLKITACVGSWGKLWTVKYKKAKAQLLLLSFREQKQGTPRDPCTQHPEGVGRPLRPPLQPDPQIHLPPQSSSHLRNQLPVNSGSKQGHLLLLFTPSCFSTSPHKACLDASSGLWAISID